MIFLDIYFSAKPYIYNFAHDCKDEKRKGKKKKKGWKHNHNTYIEDLKNHCIHNSKKEKTKLRVLICICFKLPYFPILPFYFFTHCPHTILPICKTCFYIQCRKKAISVISSGFINLYLGFCRYISIGSPPIGALWGIPFLRFALRKLAAVGGGVDGVKLGWFRPPWLLPLLLLYESS